VGKSLADPFDQLILGFDRALKTLTGNVPAQRENPAAEKEESDLAASERAHAAGLMRVNHAGEICAQALYEGQALTARSSQARDTLLHAAQEERDHLAWCAERLQELDARPSMLDPVFYGASFVMGALTGLAGDKVSLGFVEATEDQVVAHLDRHLDELPEADQKSRAIVDQMRKDESRHGEEALAQGGQAFPAPVKQLMTLISRVMTATTYRI
jgi:3-demethoxyubiquinol 3-hydroxylase